MPTFNSDTLLSRHPVNICIILAAVLICLSPGLNSLFLFDDFSNLDALIHIQHESILSSGFWEFVLGGNAGPTGRSVSLFTFALQAGSWPDSPAAFKLVNLFIHGMNAVLVYLLSYQLCMLLKINSIQAYRIAFFTSLIWAIHPIHSATVLYAIQRMALLSNFFMLAGLGVFLHFRLNSNPENQIRQLAGLSLALLITGLLSLFSKENAPSLVFYLLVIEYTVLRNLSVTPLYKKWRYVFLWLPALLIILLPLFFFSQLQLANASAFEYSLSTRLITEARILWQYIGIFLFPGISGTSLFHDVQVSQSLLLPLTTLISIVAWLGLLGLGFISQEKHKILLFALLWFLAGHVIESTILPLELFFNHRNYLAIFGLIFSALYAFFIHIAKTQLLSKLNAAPPILISLILVFLSLNVSILWRDPMKLSRTWYEADSQTARNIEFYTINLSRQDVEGMILAASIYDEAFARDNSDFRLLLNRMSLSCATSLIPHPADEFILQSLEHLNKENRDLISPIQQLVNLATSNSCNIYSAELLTAILDAISRDTSPEIHGLYEFELARLKFYSGDNDEGLRLLQSSYDLGGDPGVLFTLSLRLINAGRYAEAMTTIDQAITRLETYNNIRSGTRDSKLSILYEMRSDVLTFMNE